MLVDIPYDPAHTCCFSGSRPENWALTGSANPIFSTFCAPICARPSVTRLIWNIAGSSPA